MLLKQSLKTTNKAVRILKQGKVIICPTDTVYGFLADASDKKAVDKIYSIKKRPKDKPLPLFVKDFKMAAGLAEIDKAQEKTIKKYWPGKYTFVLQRKVGVKLYGVKNNTIALRMPKYKFLNDLLKKIGKPLVQTSVNISGEKSLASIDGIINEFSKEKKISLIIDGGNLKKAKPSKIMDLSSKKIKTLRP